MMRWILNEDLYLWKNNGIRGITNEFFLPAIVFFLCFFVSYKISYTLVLYHMKR